MTVPRSTVASLLLVVCVLFAGCAAPTADAGPSGGPADPPSDRLGWENGYWYDEAVRIDQSDGLSDRERTALVARTMARVEHVRQLEFREPVPVEVITRGEFRSRGGGDGAAAAYHAWRNQVWEAPLLVGEGANVSRVFDELYGGAVLGFYSPARGEIVVVSDAADPRIDRATLAHELVHALQDQHFGLGGAGPTLDARLAHQGITEGDARYVEQLYERRCEDEWRCIPPVNRSGSRDLAHRGVYLTIYLPYSDGPALVDRVRERGGWAAVNRMYEHPPTSTEQVIHPETYPDETPATVRVADRSGPDWTRFDLNRRTNTMGEVSAFTMLWAQNATNQSSLREDAPFSPYDYDAPPSAGWAGDTLVPYHTGEDVGPETNYGYVWKLRWDSPAEAREFADAYRSALVDGLNATRVRPGVYRVPEPSPFADAFRVDRNGAVVVVTNAPTVGELDEVRRPRA